MTTRYVRATGRYSISQYDRPDDDCTLRTYEGMILRADHWAVMAYFGHRVPGEKAWFEPLDDAETAALEAAHAAVHGHTEPSPTIVWDKIARILRDAVDGLPPDDRAARIAHDQAAMATGAPYGVSMHVEGDMIVFTWGGATLAAVERQLLTDDTATLPEGIWIPPTPDNPGDLLGD